MTISEIFYSVQGEGISSGVPCLFIRFSGCNLMCGGAQGHLVADGSATWHCDSEKVWRTQKEITIADIKKLIGPRQQYFQEHRAHIVITGGEPTLPGNAKAIREILAAFPNYFFELETNGSLDSDLFDMVQQINCSPKLKNSGMPEKLRVNATALSRIKNHKNHWFKFVISSEDDYIESMITYQPDDSRVILMPACDRFDQLQSATKMVWEIAATRGVRMCTRVHVLAYNQLTGV